jgi:hypothetical protein
MKLEIPKELMALIDSGIWPKGQEESMRQNSHILISQENLKKIAPDENYIFFYPPPFDIVSFLVEKNKEFWVKYGAIESIEPDKCLMIGDFGIGSDAAIILDYSIDLQCPSVKRQVWNKEGNYWATIASSFEEFIDKIELRKK